MISKRTWWRINQSLVKLENSVKIAIDELFKFFDGYLPNKYDISLDYTDWVFSLDIKIEGHIRKSKKHNKNLGPLLRKFFSENIDFPSNVKLFDNTSVFVASKVYKAIKEKIDDYKIVK